jgi:DNA-directed RNA polymerase sigma subunit (sigma70/sigma32)
MYWIRSGVKRNQIYQSRVVTVPQRLFENHKRIVRVQQEMGESLGRAPTRKEIGEEVGMSEVQVDRCCSAMAQRCYSLDQTISNPLKPMSAGNDKDTMYEIIESKNEDSDHNKIKHVFLREDLIETLNRHLSDEEVTLLLLRYGLMESVPKQAVNNGPLTIAELSRMVGMKPDKVRRIINRSLKHLKAVIGEEWRDFEQEFKQ